MSTAAVIEMKYDVFNAKCPTRQVLDRIADKWTVLTICALAKQTKRFTQLRREIEGISQKMLTQTLRSLERDGLVKRTVYPTVPPKVEYQLTTLGLTLITLVKDIQIWSESHIEKVLTAQKDYDKQTHHETTPGVYRHKL